MREKVRVKDQEISDEMFRRVQGNAIRLDLRLIFWGRWCLWMSFHQEIN